MPCCRKASNCVALEFIGTEYWGLMVCRGIGNFDDLFVVVVVVVECHSEQTACSDAYTMKGLKNMKKEMQKVVTQND